MRSAVVVKKNRGDSARRSQRDMVACGNRILSAIAGHQFERLKGIGFDRPLDFSSRHQRIRASAQAFRWPPRRRQRLNGCHQQSGDSQAGIAIIVNCDAASLGRNARAAGMRHTKKPAVVDSNAEWRERHAAQTFLDRFTQHGRQYIAAIPAGKLRLTPRAAT